MNKSHNETGTQLFARLIANNKNNPEESQSPKSTALTKIENILMINKQLNIDQRIFPKSIDNKKIIEVLAKPTFGKTELIMHLITRLLIPTKWKFEIDNQCFELNLKDLSCFTNDSNLKVVLIETENKFSMLRLFTIIENRLTEAYNTALNIPQFTTQIQNMMSKFIKECLKKLTVYKCDSNEQFILALAACDHYIQSLYQTKQNDQQITPIFIDTINSNYELLDKYNQHLGVNEANFTESYAVILIKRLIEKYNICIIATRSEYVNLDQSKSFLDYFYNSFQKWQLIVNKRVELHKQTSSDLNSKCKYLKLVEFNHKQQLDQKSIENNKTAERNLILDNVLYSIENSGFNLI